MNGTIEVIPALPTKTETQLVAVYGPLVPLDKVCEVYFKLGIDEAKRKALRNALPVPAFRMTDSQKAPLMIKAADLANHIDRTHEAAFAEWAKSQK